MAKVRTYTQLIKMAKEYGVDKNALFLSAAKQYDVQMRMIEQIESILNDGELLVSKEYVKSRENVYSHPLVKELPKHADSANRTLNTMLDIIVKLGSKQEVVKTLDELMDE